MLILAIGLMIGSLVLRNLIKRKAVNELLFLNGRPSKPTMFINFFLLLLVYALLISSFIFFWRFNKLVAIGAIVVYLFFSKVMSIYNGDYERARRILGLCRDMRFVDKIESPDKLLIAVFEYYSNAKLWSKAKANKYKHFLDAQPSPLDEKEITFQIMQIDNPITEARFPSNPMKYYEFISLRKNEIDRAYLVEFANARNIVSPK